MKRLLIAYKDGHNGSDDRKWPSSVVEAMTGILLSIKLPVEIHRAVRGIDCLTHWKASECASFLHYIGVAILKHFVDDNHYQNFIKLFCAVIICSNDYYGRFLPVAQKLFEQFISNYHTLFNSITSNTHNLVHVVDEVTRFGSLSTISSYPFENHLFHIKKMVRSGKLPLHQIINRISERNYSNSSTNVSKQTYPLLMYAFKTDPLKFACIKLSENFTLNNNFANKWFLTKNRRIVAMEFAGADEICGTELYSVEELFDSPFPSTNIHVFKTSCNLTFRSTKAFEVKDILCKLVAVSVYNETVFIPLHHTLPSNERL